MADTQSVTAYLPAGATPEILRRQRRCLGCSLVVSFATVGLIVLLDVWVLLAMPPWPWRLPEKIELIKITKVSLKERPRTQQLRRDPPKSIFPVKSPRDVKVSETLLLDVRDEQGKLEAVLRKFNGWIGFGKAGHLEKRFVAPDWADDPVPAGEDTTDDYTSFDLGDAFALPRRLCSGELCNDAKYALFPPDQRDRINDAVRKYGWDHNMACVQRARLRYDDTAESGFTVEDPVEPCAAASEEKPGQ
jgi:hypothetical protein